MYIFFNLNYNLASLFKCHDTNNDLFLITTFEIICFNIHKIHKDKFCDYVMTADYVAQKLPRHTFTEHCVKLSCRIEEKKRNINTVRCLLYGVTLLWIHL